MFERAILNNNKGYVSRNSEFKLCVAYWQPDVAKINAV